MTSASGENPPLACERTEFSFEFDPTSDELADGFADFFREDPEFRHQVHQKLGDRLIRALAICAGFGFLLIALPQMTIGWKHQRPWLVFAIATFGPFLIYLISRPSFATYLSAEAGAAAWRLLCKRGWIYCRPTRVTLGDDGIRLRQEDRELALSWAAVAECRDVPSGILIITGRMDALIIPRSALPEPSRSEEIVARLAAMQRRGGFDLDSVAARDLARTHLRCPECRYSMEGAASARCPECGHAVDWELIKRARREASL